MAAARKAEQFSYEAIARALLKRDGTHTVPGLIRFFRKGEAALAHARGLSAGEMAAVKDVWLALVRLRLQAAPIPPGATYRDVIALFDAVLDEVATGRRIIAGLERCASKAGESVADAWLRRELEGLAREDRSGSTL